MLKFLIKTFNKLYRTRYRCAELFFSYFIYNRQGSITLPFIVMIPFLMGLLALGWEGSRYIFERARLSDTLEQAALALTAEDNGDQTDNAKDRNLFLVRSYINTYFYGNRKPSKMKISIDVDNSSLAQVQYRITAENTHHSWLSSPYFPGFAKRQVIKDKGAAQKSIIFDKPMDVVFVADFSSSMYENFRSDNKLQKMKELKRIIAEISDIIYSSNSNNMIGFTPFSWGTNSDEHCFQQFMFKAPPRFPDNIEIGKELNKIPGLANIDASAGLTNEINRKIYENKISKDSLGKYEKLLALVSNNYAYNIEKSIDYKKTIEWISHPIEKSYSVPLASLDYSLCLIGTNAYSIPLTKKNDEINKIQKMNAGGNTLVSSGILSGVELLFKGKNKNKLLIILSDGDDNPTEIEIYEDNNTKKIPISKKLIDAGICNEIKRNIGRMVFIAIDYNPNNKYINWEKECVGKDNFYISNDTEELKNDILKSIRNKDDNIGTNIVKK